MTNQELWQAVLGEMELSISKASFTTWFKNTSIFGISESLIVISVPNIFAKEWLEKKYREQLLLAIQQYNKNITSLSCKISVIDLNTDETQVSETKEQVIDKFSGAKSVTKRKNFNGIIPKKNIYRSNLNKRYTFDSFVVGGNNELAYAACRSIAEAPGQNYNPLFIYGGVGLGKTHLLQSTGNYAGSLNPDIKIRYVSMERFTNELVDAIQKSRAKEFKNDYIDLDILILDDVQFLAGKEKTQEEFFHIFESLYQLGKQIILSSDRAPKSIPTIEDRLRSRFEGGMMADVNKPDLETRIAIINKKLVEKNFSLPENVVEYLATHIYHNVRELEGALNKIIVTFQLRNTVPTIEDVTEMTKDVISINRQKDLTVDKVIRSVGDFYDVKLEEITGKARQKKIVKPRQIVIYFLRQELNLSFPEIGKSLGGRDHSTAIYGYEKITKELENNLLLKDQLKFIKEKFIEY
ncbi:chromosomal replication initiator protein DnaA [bacterium]|jgi:chromosomal replication initiator protein|nr:chromosomal replication initiator protein DnaA [bacterium]MBT7431626.1 chromosomal replication initiator protein DnaA [bacterium]MBT7992324.1 chromosomal replication initiator protein DnaA [bacterium]